MEKKDNRVVSGNLLSKVVGIASLILIISVCGVEFAERLKKVSELKPKSLAESIQL
jgi:hypothetical protein